MSDLLFLRQQRDLDAVDLVGVAGDDVEAGIHRGQMVAIAPIASQRRVEHFAKPVDDHRLFHLRQDAVIDARIIVRSARRAGQRPAGHQDDAAAHAFDGLDLLLIGADDVVDRDIRPWRQVIGAHAAGDQRVRTALAQRRANAGSAPARHASRAPCRAARCPSPRRRRGRDPRDSDGRRWSCPSRSPSSSHGSLSANGSATTWAAE